MKWLEQFKAPVVTVEGNRFVIASAPDEHDIIDAEIVNETPRSQALARRESSEMPAQPTPKVGDIPRHSWGA